MKYLLFEFLSGRHSIKINLYALPWEEASYNQPGQTCHARKRYCIQFKCNARQIISEVSNIWLYLVWICLQPFLTTLQIGYSGNIYAKSNDNVNNFSIITWKHFVIAGMEVSIDLKGSVICLRQWRCLHFVLFLSFSEIIFSCSLTLKASTNLKSASGIVEKRIASNEGKTTFLQHVNVNIK